MKRYRKIAISQYLIVLTILVTIIGVGFSSTMLMKRISFSDDFAIFWAAGRAWLFEGISPYDPQVIEIAENAVLESGYLAEIPDQVTFLHPVINLFFYLPFSLLPYTISRAVWTTILIIAIGFVGMLGIRISGLKLSRLEKIASVLLILFWLPGIFSILMGNLTPIVVLLVLAGILMILTGHDTGAGLVLSLTFGSMPTTGLITALILIWSASRKRWSTVIAYLAGVLFLIIISILLLPTWPQEWLRVLLTTYQDWSWLKTPLLEMALLLPGITRFLSIFLHITFGIYFIVLVITVLGKLPRVFVWKAFMVMILAFLFNVQASIHHLFLCVPAIFLIFRYGYERWGLWGRILSWLLLGTIAIGPWLLIRNTIQFLSAPSIPIFTLLLPLVMLGGMIWIRWWALKIPKLPFEA